MSICNDDRRAVFTKQLAYFLKFDRWHIDEAAQLLVGAIPPVWEDAWPDSDGSVPEIDAIISRVEKLKRIWESNPAHGTHAEPMYFVHWAVKKRVPPPWLPWAKSQGYFAPDAEDGEKLLNAKSEACHLNIIGAITEIYWEAVHPGTPLNQAEVIRALSRYDGIPGLAERNLKEKISLALKSVNSV
jgi:hypothetical protein